jgi:membrane-associated phospholipid phosphatase
MLIDIFDNIGKYGPGVIFIISIYLLYKNPILATTYTIGYVLNILFNFLLKGIFRLPRPNENMKKFEAAMRLNKYMNLNRFGMPSGHAQTMIYSLVFVSFALLSTKNKVKGINTNQNWIALMVLLSIITLAQRVHFNMHSFEQIFVGSIIGALVGYGFFYYSQIHIRGSLNKKEEQWAPI